MQYTMTSEKKIYGIIWNVFEDDGAELSIFCECWAKEDAQKIRDALNAREME